MDTVPVVTPDYTTDTIVSERDLEDWARLWIYTKGLNPGIQSGQVKVGLKWKTVASGTPGIKIVQATDSDGGTEYLTSDIFGLAQAGALRLPRSSKMPTTVTPISCRRAARQILFFQPVCGQI